MHVSEETAELLKNVEYESNAEISPLFMEGWYLIPECSLHSLLELFSELNNCFP